MPTTRTSQKPKDPKSAEKSKNPEDVQKEVVVKPGRGRPRKETLTLTDGNKSPGIKREARDVIQVDRKAARGQKDTPIQSPQKRLKLSDSKSDPKASEERICSEDESKSSKADAEVVESADTGEQELEEVAEKPKSRRGRKPKSAIQESQENNDDEASEQPPSKRRKEDPGNNSGLDAEEGQCARRRSGRGSIPNSRYKDMHLFSTSKKQHQQTPKKDAVTEKQQDTSKPKQIDKSKMTEGSHVVKETITSPSKTKMSQDASKLAVKEKIKVKAFTDISSLTKANTKIQQQCEVKSKTSDKFSIRELGQGLEVTGRDGIPVVVAPENIVRVPLPSDPTSDTNVNTSIQVTSQVASQVTLSTQPGPREAGVLSGAQYKAMMKERRNKASSVVVAAETAVNTGKNMSEVETGNGTEKFVSNVKSVITGEGSGEKDEQRNKIETVSQTEGVKEHTSVKESNLSNVPVRPENIYIKIQKPMSDTIKETTEIKTSAADQHVVSTHELIPIDTVSDTVIMSSSTITTAGLSQTVATTSTSVDAITEAMVAADDGEVVVGSEVELGEGVYHIGHEEEEGEEEVVSLDTGVPTGTTVTMLASNAIGRGHKGASRMLARDADGNVMLIDKSKVHMFDRVNKEKLTQSGPKPGYVIPSPRRKSVVKIVTLSNMFDDADDKDKTPKEDEKEQTKDKTDTAQSTSQSQIPTMVQSSSILKPSQILDSLSGTQPSGVEMILMGSKTVEAAADSTKESSETQEQETPSLDQITETINTIKKELTSEVASASTQTPIDPESEKTIIPSMYKDSAFKTVTMTLGKMDVEGSEINYEESETGGKSKSEEYILVELPEGATVQQKYVKSRTKIDDSLFLNSESVVQGIYHCTLCNYQTNKKQNWYKHKKKHMGFREFECTKCPYKAATSSNLKRHLAIHDDVRAYSCPTCNLNFRQKIHLERHIKYKHEEKKIKCPFCEYMCANENPDLKVHIKRKHLPSQSPDGAINAFTCPECKLVSVSRRDLKQHMKFHKKGPELKLFCEHCSFVTDCESRLRRHELTHTKEKPFQCGLCEYRGSQKEHVIRHMRSMHNIDVVRRKRKNGGEDQSKDLSKLIESSDYTAKDKIFACNHCSMKFSKLINLYKHLHSQHRSIMPEDDEDYSCVICDFHTNSKKNLLVHMRRHNMTDHSPPSHLYSCVLCRYTNPRRRNLFQHMRKKHHIEIVMKDDGSTSCFITDTSNIQGDNEHNVLTVGDIVTTTTADTDSQDGVHNVISLEDLTTIVTPEPNGDGSLIIDTAQLQGTSLSSMVQQHEAAEAIEGLQALAGGQINLADSVIEEVQVMDGLDPITMETMETNTEGESEKPSIELSAEQLVNLSSGDYVEINGEMYKVEIAADDSSKKSTALTAVSDITTI